MTVPVTQDAVISVGYERYYVKESPTLSHLVIRDPDSCTCRSADAPCVHIQAVALAYPAASSQ